MWIGCAGAVVLVSLQVRLEERHLIALHGGAYLEYASSVGRFVPWLGRLRRASESRTVDPRSDTANPGRPRVAAKRR
jgi:hypothetical protein